MPSHSYTLSLEDRVEYVYAHVNAQAVGVEQAVTYIRELVDRVGDHRAKKLLFLRETHVEIPSREYELIGSIVMNVIPEDVRVAVVDRSPITPAIVETINTVAQEQRRDIKAFDDLDEARTWLLSC